MVFACVINGTYFGKGVVECKTDIGYAINMEDGTQQEFLFDEVIPYSEYMNMFT